MVVGTRVPCRQFVVVVEIPENRHRERGLQARGPIAKDMAGCRGHCGQHR